MDNHQDGNENEDITDENLPQEKEILCTGVAGTVKWFNVKLRYGFVCRHDTKEDVFIHQSAIAKANPNHPRKSVDDGEEIIFDVVNGIKGVEAANVTGIDGNCVKGSEYALKNFRGRGRGIIRGRGRGNSGETGRRTQDYYRNGGGRGRPMGPGRYGQNQSGNVKRNTEMDTDAQQLLDEQRKAKKLIREEEKECLCTRVTGKVKWFNVKRGYGFVCRNDNQEDVFIHHSAIVKNNPEHARKSVEDGEEILFDIVRGSKGNEVSNVSALDGNCVKGSEYARKFPRYSKPRNMNRSREISESDNFSRPFNRGGPPFSRGASRPYRVRPFQSGRPPFRDGYAPEMPPYGNEFDYYYGPPPPQMMPNRGGPRGSRFPGRMFPPRGRGGFPRDFPPINDFYSRRPMRGRGPPRGRGRMSGRGGRGWYGGRGGHERNDDRVDSRDDEEPEMNGGCQ